MNSAPAPAAGHPPLTELCHTLKWPFGVPADDFLELLDEQLLPRPRAKVAVLGGRSAPFLCDVLRFAYPELRVVLVDPDADPSEVHVALCVCNPYNAVVDLAEDGAADQADVFLRTFMHLGRGGTYLAQRVVPADEDLGDVPVDEPPQQLRQLGLARILDRASRAPFGAEDPEPLQDLHRLGKSIGEVTATGEAVLVRNALRVRPKLRDHETNPVLAARPGIGRVIESRPRTTLVSRCDYQESPRVVDPSDVEFRDAYQPTVFDVPPLHLRVYDRPTCGRGQIVESNGLLLPDTFRLHRHRRLKNAFIEDSSPLFGDPRTALGEATPLAGAYFHFDSEWPGHFGHTTTEQISRLWAYGRAKELDPDLKLLTTLPRARKDQRLQDWEVSLLEPFGIEETDVVVFDQAVSPERLYAAVPMFSAPDYVHPDIVETWNRIGRSLGARGARPGLPRRVFCSRRPSLKRACTNVPDVEQLFAQRGFTVVYPEDHTMAEQVAMFRAAEVIGGFAGSGLFTMAFREEPVTVVMLAPQSYTARNEYMFASVRGHSLRVAWSTPDIPHPVRGWSAAAFASSFRFDLESEGAYVTEVLDGLEV